MAKRSRSFSSLGRWRDTSRWRTAAWLLAGIMLWIPARAQAASLGHPIKTPAAYPLRRKRPPEVAIHIPVVVRDPDGHSVGGLRRQDFRLLVDGRFHVISDFAENIIPPAPTSPHAVTTLRYIALYFDDLHMNSTEIIRATDGADGYFAHRLGTWDRVGIFTASGENTLPFTHNLLALHNTLMTIHAHPLPKSIVNGCPPMNDFEGYLVVDIHQALAREVAIEQALQCLHLETDPAHRAPVAVLRRAARQADVQARRVLAAEERRSAQFLDHLDSLIHTVAQLPDPRRIIVISPGFLTPAFGPQVDDLVRRATQLNITVSTIDIRPQLTQPSFDTAGFSAAQAQRVALAAARYRMKVGEASMATEVVMQLAAGTGGNFVPNTYDPEFAFPMAARLPRSLYILTFEIPRYLANGSYHRVRVELLRHAGFSVQAEDGCYVPGAPPRPPTAFRRSRPVMPRPAPRLSQRPAG